MGTVGNLLTPELIGSAIAGLLIAGLVVRNFVKGWVEAKTQAAQVGTNAAMVSAVAIGWERDQRELVLQTLIRIADALEAQVESLNDQERNETKRKLDEILKRDERFEEMLRRLDKVEESRSRK